MLFLINQESPASPLLIMTWLSGHSEEQPGEWEHRDVPHNSAFIKINFNQFVNNNSV